MKRVVIPYIIFVIMKYERIVVMKQTYGDVATPRENLDTKPQIRKVNWESKERERRDER